MKYTTDNFYFESFNSLREFAQTIEKRPINGFFEGASTSRVFENMKSKSAKFYGTLNYDQAIELLSGGDKSNFEKLQDIKLDVDFKVNTNDYKKKVQNAVAGVLPNVPNAIIGVPKSMLAINCMDRKNKVLNIFVNRAVHSKIDSKDILKSGLEITNLIVALEKKGIRVNLYVAWYGKDKARNAKTFGGVCKIKSALAPLNKLSIVYPFVHPSFFRRNIFRWMESLPFKFNASSDLYYAYGYIKRFDGDFMTQCKKIVGKTETLFIDQIDIIDGTKNLNEIFKSL